MMKLVNIASTQEALIHVYSDRVILNRPAMELLHIVAGDRLSFKIEDGERGERIYVGKINDGGFITASAGKRVRISSAKLSRYLADHLEGIGTYKISALDAQYDVYHRPFYNIFWKKFD